MKWLEVIELRAVDSHRELVESTLNALIDEVGSRGNKQNVMAFRRAWVDSDYSIHIFHESDQLENFGSPLGVRIVSALREFGLVHQRVWVGIHQ
jgi:hypothetical protein